MMDTDGDAHKTRQELLEELKQLRAQLQQAQPSPKKRKQIQHQQQPLSYNYTTRNGATTLPSPAIHPSKDTNNNSNSINLPNNYWTHGLVGTADSNISTEPLSAEEFRELSSICMHNMFQFVALLRPNGKMVLANTAALKGAGLTIKDIHGVLAWECRWWLVSKQAQEKLKHSIEECARERKPIRYDTTVFCSESGTEVVDIDFNMNPLIDPITNEVKYILAEGRDITEKKHMECQIRKGNEELRIMNEKLTEMDELKTSFFAHMSHELRTPLSLILLPTERLQASRDLLPTQKRDLDVIRRNALTLLKQVNDILEIAKFEAGKATIQYSEINLETLITATVSHFDVLAQDHRMNWSFESSVIPASENPIVQVDPDKLQRVILNLLSNAFKFTPPGGTIRAKVVVDKLQNEIRLSIADSGIGIPDNLKSVIFEPFRQQTGFTARKYGGTGLGLAIVKEFVELHGGTVEVTDAEEGGAKFTVIFPVSPHNKGHDVMLVPDDNFDKQCQHTAQQTIAQLQSQVTPVSDAIPVKPTSSELGERMLPFAQTTTKCTVLVVEDNAEMSQYITDSLSRDFNVHTAKNGKEGLEVALKIQPDVIVSDLMMPVMSGDEMVECIRNQHPELSDIPILILSARSDDVLRVRLLEFGVQDYVNKPFAPTELRARVKNLSTLRRAMAILQRDLNSKNNDLVQLSHELSCKRQDLESSLVVTQQACNEAERLNRVKDEFLMTLSHELRTPLTGILGWTELLKMDMETDLRAIDLTEAVKAVQIIETCAQTQCHIIEDLLDVSAIISGKMKLNNQVVDIHKVVTAAIDSVKLAASSKSIEISVASLSHHPQDAVLGDADRLLQVVWNLLTNAIKFTKRNDKIDIRIECGPAGSLVALGQDTNMNDRIVTKVSVTDHGIGINSENIPKLFQRFGQLDTSSTRGYNGLGLGLSICRHIVELHGGEVVAESRGEGHGSTFSFHLPTLSRSAMRNIHVSPSSTGSGPTQVSPSPIISSTQSAKRLRDINVIVTDDDRTTSALIEAILRRESANVYSFSRVADALQHIKINGMPHVILTDVSMPEHDGFKLIEAVRKLNSEVPVAAVTAYCSDEDKQRALQSGFSMHISKPIRPADLIDDVCKLIQLHKRT